MIKEVGGKIEGNVDAVVRTVFGDINTKTPTMSGDIQPAGQKIIQNAYWGGILGEIERQEDLQVELHKRDAEAVPVSEVERILYFD